jgi:hypothetical protein
VVAAVDEGPHGRLTTGRLGRPGPTGPPPGVARTSFERLFPRSTLAVVRREPVGIPFDVKRRGADDNAESVKASPVALVRFDVLGAALRLTLFAYRTATDRTSAGPGGALGAIGPRPRRWF